MNSRRRTHVALTWRKTAGEILDLSRASDSGY
jgi:hypothetical protein